MAFFMFALALLFYIYDYFIQVSPAVMTQPLMESLSIGAAELGLLGAFFYYSYTIMQLPAGFLLDRFGVKKTMGFSALISAVGVLLFSISAHFYLTAFSRLLIGVGSSVAFLSALMIIRQWFNEKHFPILVGFIQLGSCVGSVFAEAPLAAVVNHYGWRHSMFIISMITFGLACIFFICVKESNKKTSTDMQVTPIDFSASFLRRLTVNRNMLVIFFCGFACWVPVGVVGALWGVPYLMIVYHWTNVDAGTWCSLFWIGLAMGSPLVGFLCYKINSQKKPIVLCFVIGFVGSIMLLCAPFLPAWMTGLALFLLGFMASAQALTFSVVRNSVPAYLFGAASGIVNMAAILGGGCAQWMAGLLLQGGAHRSVVDYTILDYQRGLSTVLVSMVLGIVFALFLQEKNDAHKKLL